MKHCMDFSIVQLTAREANKERKRTFATEYEVHMYWKNVRIYIP
jgi:hypothetical protein